MWIDAHPDIHTYKSTVSGNTHGTPLSVCTSLEKTHWASRMSCKMLSFDRLLYVGIRDIDDWEEHIIKTHNIKHLPVEDAIKWIAENKDIPLHISFDVDALDPTYISSTGTRVEDGLAPHEVRAIIEEALIQDNLVSLDVVEFNPQLGDPVKSMEQLKEVFMV